MAFPDRPTVSKFLTILLVVVVLAIVYIARAVIAIFVFAILFAYLIDPVVRFLQRHSLFFKNLRGPHILEAYLAFLILIALIAHGLAPGLLSQSGKLFKEIPALLDGLSTGEIVTEMGGRYGWTDTQQLRLKSFLVQHRTDIQGFARALERSIPTAIAGLVVIPILALFFLSDGANLANSLIRLASTRDNLEAVQSLADDLNVMLQHYIRAKVILAGLSFIYYSAAMLALGFPHALALGLLGGILEFIPAAGWMISATAIISAGVLTHSHWTWMAALLGVWRMLMDYWISPRIMGHELEIHPLLALFTVMVGGAIGGIVGIYLSVPLIAALRVFWRKSVLLRPHSERTALLSASKTD
jgi:predicted PurR-regulated permease PerM